MTGPQFPHAIQVGGVRQAILGISQVMNDGDGIQGMRPFGMRSQGAKVAGKDKSPVGGVVVERSNTDLITNQQKFFRAAFSYGHGKVTQEPTWRFVFPRSEC